MRFPLFLSATDLQEPRRQTNSLYVFLLIRLEWRNNLDSEAAVQESNKVFEIEYLIIAFVGCWNYWAALDRVPSKKFQGSHSMLDMPDWGCCSEGMFSVSTGN